MSRYDAYLDDGGDPSKWEEVSHSCEGPATKLLLSMLGGEEKPNSLAMAYMARIAAHECGYTPEDKKDEKE